MADHETSMRQLLVGVRSLLEAERTPSGPLKSVRQVKRGVLPIRPLYPCVTVVPITERNIKYRSGRRAVVQRDVVVHVLSQDLRGRAGINIAKDIADEVLTILRDDPCVTESGGHLNAFTLQFGKMNFHNNQPIDGAGLYNISLPVAYFSNESLPAQVVYTGGQVDNPSARDLGTAIHTKLKGKKATTLAKFRSIALEDWEPVATYPRLLVEALEETQGERWGGVNAIEGNYRITFESLVGTAKDTALDFHLDLLEPIKDALQEEDHWDGKTIKAEMGQISFDAGRENQKPVYRTTMGYYTTSKHAV